MQCRIGVIGCGELGFAAMHQCAAIPDVQLVAATDVNEDNVEKAVQQFGLIHAPSVNALCQRPDIDLVYVASPAFLHHDHAMAALNADKHVVVEVPLALSLGEANDMFELAHAEDRILVANLMQRYNQLTDQVGELIELEILGKPLHGYFENYASVERLGRDDLNWGRSQGGGIFIEHGEHSFDLFANWLGAGEVVSAQRLLRDPLNSEDQVQCCVRYRDDILVNYYHGFHQPGCLDRQELRIVFERGHVTLHGWVPTRLCLDAVLGSSDKERLVELFATSEYQMLETSTGKQRDCERDHDFQFNNEIRLTVGRRQDKTKRCGELVKLLIEDQINGCADKFHRRRINEKTSRESLRMAVQANEMARAGSTTSHLLTPQITEMSRVDSLLGTSVAHKLK
ncbi:Gfo/Idh/MocA family protein [Rubripirellula reticaptiva]|uniref:Inositol 2-dehydrogenase/D-chiro-inositol 3-dehydrogenase n=1 Tax=Rubripirellula reticaptiva TaxID=2528013 RepID=A0A5C6ECN1_9BACT|nr:Gfo/Idh/MocA family oxidoreductase [Rubripirellula reticaptiva]TWU46668.1 Inositol 2-dehydrogenase/D-chiro-inositol 3-dehydrogenase [Rubripirellula reticaptiva]